MSNILQSITKSKRERHRNRYYKKKINEEECENIEPILSEFLKLSIQNKPTCAKRKENSIKFIQNNSKKKCQQNVTKLCISTGDEQNRMMKVNRKDRDIKSNVYPSLQKESEKLSIKKV